MTPACVPAPPTDTNLEAEISQSLWHEQPGHGP